MTEEDLDEEVEELLEDLTEYDDLNAMLDELDEDIDVGPIDEGGGVFETASE